VGNTQQLNTPKKIVTQQEINSGSVPSYETRTKQVSFTSQFPKSNPNHENRNWHNWRQNTGL